jgi:hypothetical protein
MPQLIHRGRLPRNRALSHARHRPDHRTLLHRILRRLDLDPDDANARILRAAIMLTIAEVAEPGFQGGRVVLADEVAVGGDRGVAGERGPVAGCAVDEGEVDGGVLA